MSSIVKHACEELVGAEIDCVVVKGKPLFKAKSVADIFKHTSTSKALKGHVYDEDKQKYFDLVVDGPSERSVRLGASVSNVNFVRSLCSHLRKQDTRSQSFQALGYQCSLTVYPRNRVL